MNADIPPGLFDRPVLVIDPGVHTGQIPRIDVASAAGLIVTGSHDRTVRLWNVGDGRLIDTIRLPQGPGPVGSVYAVAITPDGAVIAVGGWMKWTQVGSPDHIYLIDTVSRTITGRIEGLPTSAAHLAFSADGRRLAAALGAG